MILIFTFLMQVVPRATLSHLLPLQLGFFLLSEFFYPFERFQHIGLTKIKVSHSLCGPQVLICHSMRGPG